MPFLSWGQSPRLRALGASDLGSRPPARAAAAHDELAADEEPVDPVRAGEDEPATGSAAPAELEPVDAPDGEVGAPARRERADVVPAEHGRAAARAEPERLARRHRPRPAATSRDEQRLLDLEEQVAALVRGRPVDAESDAHARVEHSRTGATPAPSRRFDVGQWATPVPVAAKRADVAVGEMHAVRAPDVRPASQPSRRYSTGVQP